MFRVYSKFLVDSKIKQKDVVTLYKCVATFVFTVHILKLLHEIGVNPDFDDTPIFTAIETLVIMATF
jgi:hypothetical protein